MVVQTFVCNGQVTVLMREVCMDRKQLMNSRPLMDTCQSCTNLLWPRRVRRTGKAVMITNCRRALRVRTNEFL